MLKIAITGGIGSGKSTTTKYFAALGVPIIDADEISHKLLQPNTETFKKTIAHFGINFLTPQKTLNRKKLRDRIFNNKNERLWLEKLLHPKIAKEITKLSKEIKKPYCIIAVPLLFETNLKLDIDRVLIIDSLQNLRIKRVCDRDNTTTKQAQNIIKTQVNRSTRFKLANDIIYNNGSLAHLKQQIKKLHRHYLNIA